MVFRIIIRSQVLWNDNPFRIQIVTTKTIESPIYFHVFFVECVKDWLADVSLLMNLNRFLKEEGANLFLLVQPCAKLRDLPSPIPLLSLPPGSFVDANGFFETQVVNRDKEMIFKLQRMKEKTPTMILEQLEELGLFGSDVKRESFLTRNMFFFGGIVIRVGKSEKWERDILPIPFHFHPGSHHRPEGMPASFEFGMEKNGSNDGRSEELDEGILSQKEGTEEKVKEKRTFLKIIQLSTETDEDDS